MIYSFCMEKELVKIDSLIVKQAVRDIASKDVDTSTKALSYFISKDFYDLCHRNNLNADKILMSIKELNKYPLLSRKKMSNDIARLIDRQFV